MKIGRYCEILKHRSRPKGRQRLAVAFASTVVTALTLTGCGGGSPSSMQSGNNPQLSGNWQFAMSAPSDGSFSGGLSGGFLLQKGNSAQGQITYSVSSPSVTQKPCATGVTAVTVNVNGQNVTVTAAVGSQTLSLTGAVSQDGSSMSGTYNSTDGQGCGTAQNGVAWNATKIASISGSLQGIFHSTGVGSQTELANQSFLVSGNLVQGPNVGASSATVTGTLTFAGYPCVDTASVNGEISGNSVILQIFGTNGLNVGQIGAATGASNSAIVGSVSGGGYAIQGSNSYIVTSKTCAGGIQPGDEGNLCLGIGNTTACTQPITLTPAVVVFSGQLLGLAPATRTITLTNTDPAGSTLNGIQLNFQALPTSVNFNGSDFDGISGYSEHDNCSSAPGSPFSLGPQQSCTITISFAPQQSCPWLPVSGVPSECPPFVLSAASPPPGQFASVTVTSPASADPDKSFVVPISGFGMSVIQSSTPELDFSAEAQGETSVPQTASFTNVGSSPVQVLPAVNSGSCPGTPSLLHPPVAGVVPGIQVALGNSITPFNSTISYMCDADPVSHLPNFQVVSDSCSGTLLAPQQSCSLTVQYAPQQSGASQLLTLDSFVELNTQECTGSVTTDCEIDSGRFPLELKANPPSPLRMSPAAALDFGLQFKGVPSDPLVLTLLNDPKDPNSQTINFNAITLKGNSFTETDNCSPSLAPGSSCTVTVIYTASTVGYQQGTITLNYNNGQVQTIYLRGQGQ